MRIKTIIGIIMVLPFTFIVGFTISRVIITRDLVLSIFLLITIMFIIGISILLDKDKGKGDEQE